MRKLSCNVFSAALIIFLLLEAIIVNMFNLNFYKTEYAKLNVAADVGCSYEELITATEVLLDYTADRREDMVVTAVIDGAEREVFNKREKDHMVDVKALYLSADVVRKVCIAAVVLIYFLNYGQKGILKDLSRAFPNVSMIFLIVIGAIALYAAVDFNSFWTNFHHVFFTKNDFWLLNPATDLMIRFFPEQFFADIVLRIVLTFFAGFGILNGLCFLYRKKVG